MAQPRMMHGGPIQAHDLTLDHMTQPIYDGAIRNFCMELSASGIMPEYVHSSEEFMSLCRVTFAKCSLPPQALGLVQRNHLTIPGTEDALFYIWSAYVRKAREAQMNTQPQPPPHIQYGPYSSGFSPSMVVSGTPQ